MERSQFYIKDNIILYVKLRFLFYVSFGANILASILYTKRVKFVL